MKRICILLIAVTLLTGMVGCDKNSDEYYTLAITSTSGGSVIEPGEGTFDYLDYDKRPVTVTLETVSDDGYQFKEWTGDIDTLLDRYAENTTIKVDSAYSITANFEEIPIVQYQLTIDSTEGGNVTTPGEGVFIYDTGTSVPLVAEAQEGYWFVAWTGDVDTIDNVHDDVTNINMTDHCSIVAKFVPDDVVGVWDWYDLDGIRNDLDRSYVLMNNLDSTTAGYEELVSAIDTGGIGWQPIGTSAQRFIGTFDGQGYEIFNLFIHRPVTSWMGLFGYVGTGGIIQNVGLMDAYVTGYSAVGTLMGAMVDGTVSNSFATSTINGYSYVGGLIGSISGSNVNNAYTTGNVIGSLENTGGLVGQSTSNIIDDSYSTCTVTGGENTGGLIGAENGSSSMNNCWANGNVISTSSRVGGLIGLYNDTGAVMSNSYSTGAVTGFSNVGGLIGSVFGGTVNSCFATGTVTGSEYAGGLIGYLYNSLLTNSYSTGNVTCDSHVGGLIGIINSVTVTNSYSTGTITGSSYTGGLIGNMFPSSYTVSNCFWDMETSGQATSIDGTGKTTAEMKDVTTFQDAGWHIISIAAGESNPVYLWNIVDDETYPFLSWEPVP